ncbi:hypothetical protein ACH47V_25460 [Micromonospora chersina]|uniref:hypothetical protein n=1 Tax=Micromonospora chersina TaxID=47854 RepID=UPI0033CD7C7A
MSFNPHRQAALAIADVWMDDPGGRERIAHAYHLSRDDSPARATVVDVFGQPHRAWDVGQLFALACLDHLLVSGLLLLSEHPIGSLPRGDKHRAENQAALDRHLDPDTTVSVDVDQRAGEQDGFVSWAKAIPGNGRNGVEEVPPGSAPLEIGSTDASTTALHLCKSGAVARWPYRHDTLSVLVMRDRNLINAVRLEQTKTDDDILRSLADFMSTVWSGWWGFGPATYRRGVALGPSSRA